MLIFNCTKAAADFFSKIVKGKKVSPIIPAPYKTIVEDIDSQPTKSVEHNKSLRQWHWQVHLVKVKRKNVLIIMDFHSRFAICLSGLKKGDESGFITMFKYHLRIHVNELLNLIDDEKLIDTSLDYCFGQHKNITFYQRGDRSVQSHINDVAWHFEMESYKQGEVLEGMALIEQDQFVNRLLRKRKGEKDYFEPQYELIYNWLTVYGKYNKNQADLYIKRLKDLERAEFRESNPDLNYESEPVNSKPQQKAVQLVTPLSSSKINNVVSIDKYRKK